MEFSECFSSTKYLDVSLKSMSLRRGEIMVKYFIFKKNDTLKKYGILFLVHKRKV